MWIEIEPNVIYIVVKGVIPRIGGCGLKYRLHLCRMRGIRVIPRIGGCGLKSLDCLECLARDGHPPHRGMWIEIKRIA